MGDEKQSIVIVKGSALGPALAAGAIAATAAGAYYAYTQGWLDVLFGRPTQQNCLLTVQVETASGSRVRDQTVTVGSSSAVTNVLGQAVFNLPYGMYTLTVNDESRYITLSSPSHEYIFVPYQEACVSDYDCPADARCSGGQCLIHGGGGDYIIIDDVNADGTYNLYDSDGNLIGWYDPTTGTMYSLDGDEIDEVVEGYYDTADMVVKVVDLVGTPLSSVEVTVIEPQFEGKAICSEDSECASGNVCGSSGFCRPADGCDTAEDCEQGTYGAVCRPAFDPDTGEQLDNECRTLADPLNAIDVTLKNVGGVLGMRAYLWDGASFVGPDGGQPTSSYGCRDTTGCTLRWSGLPSGTYALVVYGEIQVGIARVWKMKLISDNLITLPSEISTITRDCTSTMYDWIETSGRGGWLLENAMMALRDALQELNEGDAG